MLIGKGEKIFEGGSFRIGEGKVPFFVHNNEQKVQISFCERGCWNGFWRVVFRINDIFYQTAWFYFAPFLVFFLSFLIPYWLGGYNEKEEEVE